MDKVRRAFRVFLVAGLVALAATLIYHQFLITNIEAATLLVGISVDGVNIQWAPKVTNYSFDTGFRPDLSEHYWPRWMFVWPWLKRVAVADPEWSLFLPWWLVILGWGGLAAILWRWPRRRKVIHGFPVEVEYRRSP